MQHILRCFKTRTSFYQCINGCEHALRLASLAISRRCRKLANGHAYVRTTRSFSSSPRRCTAENAPDEQQEEAPDVIAGKVARSVYISNIPFRMPKKHLAGTFEVFGEVLAVRLFRNAEKQFTIAFIEFADEKSVEKAVEQDGRKIIGRRLVTIRRAKRLRDAAETTNGAPTGDETEIKPSPVLFIRNFAPGTTSRNLWDFFDQFAPVKLIRIPYDKLGRKRTPRDYAFVEFADTEAATKVLKNPKAKTFHDQTLKLEIARSKGTLLALDSLDPSARSSYAGPERKNVQ